MESGRGEFYHEKKKRGRKGKQVQKLEASRINFALLRLHNP